MDFQGLNICIDDWIKCLYRKINGMKITKINVSLLDLKKAYLQINIDKSLWLYQAVVFKSEGISYHTCGPKDNSYSFSVIL